MPSIYLGPLENTENGAFRLLFQVLSTLKNEIILEETPDTGLFVGLPLSLIGTFGILRNSSTRCF